MPTNENEIGRTQEGQGTDLLGEAQALSEMSKRNKELEAQNAELLAAKRKYYDSVLNGQSASVPEVRTRDQIRKELFGKEDKDSISNYEYAKLVVELDDACIREQGESCFLPKGKGVTPTVDERDVAARMNTVLKDCIKAAESDPTPNERFDQELARRIRK